MSITEFKSSILKKHVSDHQGNTSPNIEYFDMLMFSVIAYTGCNFFTASYNSHFSNYMEQVHGLNHRGLCGKFILKNFKRGRVPWRKNDPRGTQLLLRNFFFLNISPDVQHHIAISPVHCIYAQNRCTQKTVNIYLWQHFILQLSYY